MAQLRRIRRTGAFSRLRDRFPVGRQRRRSLPVIPAVGPFASLDRRDLAALASMLTVSTAGDGVVLATQGGTQREFIVVLDGRVGVAIDDDPVAVIERGAHFGALQLVDPDAYPHPLCTFTVMGSAVLARATPEQFDAVMDRFPTARARVLATARVSRAYLAGRELAVTEAEAAAAAEDPDPQQR